LSFSPKYMTTPTTTKVMTPNPRKNFNSSIICASRARYLIRCEGLHSVTGPNITSDFSNGCYAMRSSPSARILATVSERPKAALQSSYDLIAIRVYP
jgi:hypothetical protein